MTDPQVALAMLGLFLFAVFLGFPIAFTLMAMGIGFGYYAYFDADRMWRPYPRARSRRRQLDIGQHVVRDCSTTASSICS